MWVRSNIWYTWRKAQIHVYLRAVMSQTQTGEERKTHRVCAHTWYINKLARRIEARLWKKWHGIGKYIFRPSKKVWAFRRTPYYLNECWIIHTSYRCLYFVKRKIIVKLLTHDLISEMRGSSPLMHCRHWEFSCLMYIYSLRTIIHTLNRLVVNNVV